MKFQTAYDTTACNGFMMKKTVEALEVAFVHGQLANIPDNFSLVLVEGGASVTDAVPAFAHPLLFQNSQKETFLAADVRSTGSWNQQQWKFVVRNHTEYQLTLYRAKLNQIWIQERPQALRDVSMVPMAVYAAWISEAVGRRFALDPREQFELAILAAIFYSTLFSDEDADERDQQRMATAVSRATRAKVEDVFKILDELETPLTTAASFCEAAAKVTQSVRLQELNAGILFAILGGTWYGTNAKEMVAVALEHPPTWITLLLAAFTDRSFKNSGITKVAERVGTKNGGQDFVRSVLNLINVTVGA